jgi:toxin ParE1/3/4
LSRRLVVRPLAREDLDEQARYIASDSIDAAIRFLDAAEAAFDRLRSTPEIGKLWKFQRSDLSGVRSWPVPGFEKHLIFYRVDSRMVDVLRVVHSARDLASLFGLSDF